MYKIHGKITYDPKVAIGKNDTMFKPWWMIISFDCDVSDFYAWLIKKKTGLKLQSSAWGPHISVIRGEEPTDISLWGKRNGDLVEVTIDPDVRTNSRHWWLRVHCEDAKQIRESLGLPKDGSFGLHLTIGSTNQKDLDVSEYALKNFIRFPNQ